MIAFRPDNIPFDAKLFPLPFSESYLSFQKARYGDALVIGDEKETYIPLVIENKFGFKRGRFLYTPFRKEQVTAEEEHIFLKELALFLKKKKIADVIFPPLHICVFHGLPDNGWSTSLGVMRIDLENKTEDAIFSDFQPQYRNVIRKAQREGVQIAFGMSCFDDFYNLYKDTLLRTRAIADPKATITSLVQFLGDEHIQCGVAYVEGKPDAAIFNIFNSTEAYNMYAGTAFPGRNKGSLRLLHWECIRQYKLHDVARYCLGGARMGNIKDTKYQRLLDFKMRFGATCEEGYHFIMPITSKYKLYKPLMKAYLRLKGIREEGSTLPFRKISLKS